ncbi:MAG: TetR/AcrR family transcriptional regulator [Bacteroidales bacterium]|nr:TetR/AcrR family transcriptional regulator [Bacteroidales bacterium]
MSNNQCDNKKEEILNAAEKEFILHGYAGARTVAIAKRAGVGHPLLHYHFKTKKDLFKFVVLRKIDLLRQSVLMSWDESEKSFPEKLSATIGKHFDFVKDNADYLRFQLQEMEQYPEIFTDIRSKAAEEMNQLLEKLQVEIDRAAERGEIRPIDARLLLEDIISLNLLILTTGPIVQLLNPTECDEHFYERRKSENIRLITHRLTLNLKL